MTDYTATHTAGVPAPVATTPGSIAPVVSMGLVREAATVEGVCVRPVVRRCTDTETGATELIPIPCGSTLASVCPSCAETNRRLRMQQCREGWHLTEEPEIPARPADDSDSPNDSDLDAEQDEGLVLDEEPSRRVRSTRRRDDAPDLPRLPVQNRTIGTAFTDSKTGRSFRPSMFVTLTLGSYGRVHPDGTPVDPSSYDYARAARDAVFFPKLWDRFVQNLRRAVGYDVQYFAAIEPQKRLAPHLHTAIRGAIPRALLRQVIAATYATVWWPSFDEPVYTGERPPEWDITRTAYVDPDTRQPLRTWDQALDDLDADPAARPAHVLRFGRQSDIQGLLAGSPEADRRVGYLTKYLTKAITEATSQHHDDANDQGQADEQRTGKATARRARREAHITRLHREVLYVPCSPECANWLRYGIQPKNPEPAMAPGQCAAKHHRRDNLGLGGRRVLVSRKWTGKTLAEHKQDRINAVRTVLEAAGINPDDHTVTRADTTREDGRPRYVWDNLDPTESTIDYARVINTAIDHRQRWRHQYQQAQQALHPPVDNPLGNTPERNAA